MLLQTTAALIIEYGTCSSNNTFNIAKTCSVCISLCLLQKGNQAIHMAATAGQLHILTTLVEEYCVAPDTTNKV